jgi:hypothetical protein
MKADLIDSFVVQNPFKMGYESTRAIGLHSNGQTRPAWWTRAPRSFSPATSSKPEIKAPCFLASSST